MVQFPKKNGKHKEKLRDLLKDPRYEILPLNGVMNQASYVPANGTVTITCSASKGIEATLRVTERLITKQLSVVPHIAARLVVDKEYLKLIVDQLQKLGVKEIFIPGGDSAEPAGEYTCSGELLVALSQIHHGFERIGVAAHPEGHPYMDNEQLIQVLIEKQRIATYMVTQMCFSPQILVDWIDCVRNRGVTLPIYIGMPGVAERWKLIQIAQKIGVGGSIRFLRGNSGFLPKMFFGKGFHPGKIIEGLTPLLNNDRYHIEGFHFYTFNQVDRTEQWRRKIIGLSQK